MSEHRSGAEERGFGAEPAPDVWGIGRVVVDDTVTPWPVSAADVDDEAVVAADHLRSLGAGAGDFVLVVALLSEAIHAVPLERAAGLVGALYSSADATAMDAFRTDYLIQQLHPRAVIGIRDTVVTGLRENDRPLAQVFGSVDAIATADEGAWHALVDAGLSPRRWIKVGPTSALECAERSGLHIDGERWSAEIGDGEVLLTNRVPRLTPCDHLATGVRGTVTDDPCPCGRPGPRLLPSWSG
jgi:hypothetical protein